MVCDHSSKTSCPVSLWVISHSLQEAGQQHWGIWGALEPGQGGRRAEEAGREGVDVGCYHQGGTVGLGLVACKLVSLPSLEMAC